MRLPNGYGSVYKLSGNRRCPWVARKTTGFNEKGHPIYQIIGYYKNQADARQALSEYNDSPYDIFASKKTFAQVYDEWSTKKFEKISQSNINGYKASYKLCGSLYEMPFKDIKLIHLQKVVDNCGKNYPTLRKLKVLFGQLFDYAVIHEIIGKDKNIVEYVDISVGKNTNKIDSNPFSKDEISLLWQKSENKNIQIILILIYTGVRISELLNLKKNDIHKDEKWFYIRESKTESGIRAVPIADKIEPFFDNWMSSKCDYLVHNDSGNKFSYTVFMKSYWEPILKFLNLQHKPHDCRHTCISLLTVAGGDERIIKKIVGHKGKSVTESVYTHFEIKELLNAINLI